MTKLPLQSTNPAVSRGRSLRNEWLDLPTELRFPVIAAIIADTTAKVFTWGSLIKRPANKVRGPKWAWVLVSFVNGIGPISYVLFGRK